VTDGVPGADVTDLLLAFVEGTSDLVGVVDEQSRVLYLNNAARKRLGVGDATGLTTADLFPPEVFERYYDEIRPTLLRAGAWHGELEVLTESGEALPMTMTIVARVGPGGEVNGLVTHGRVTEVSSADDTRIDSRPDGDAMGATEVSLTRLADELAIAVSHGLIQPHVQPVVDLHRGVIVGYQGLARWEHPRRGLLEAEQFVDIVANAPVLSVIDLAVLRRTAAAAARAARNGMRVRAYGHLSRRLLGDRDVARYLGEVVDELRIAPSDLYVEIAHAFVVRPSHRVERALRDLRATGLRMVLSAVDGECEVNQILEYGFDELRLARPLVSDARHDPTRRRVIDGTVALARALGLAVIAVGIDTDADRAAMREAGCDFGQGDLFGPVQPAGVIN
jgi:EAL domain-containing protein (putative c-di-GMP-specific phosphodiesterase class I)